MQCPEQRGAFLVRQLSIFFQVQKTRVKNPQLLLALVTVFAVKFGEVESVVQCAPSVDVWSAVTSGEAESPRHLPLSDNTAPGTDRKAAPKLRCVVSAAAAT